MDCSSRQEARGDESGGALSPSGASKGTGRLDKLSGVEYPRGPGGHRHLDRLSGGELLRSLVLPYVLRGLSSSPDYVSRRSMDKAGSGEHIRTAGAFLPGSLPAKRQAPCVHTAILTLLFHKLPLAHFNKMQTVSVL
ncbi:hypothetical protein HPB49_019234 [Dermacentor silvarum]|uniref:Uncharacterized protein n=1 Tax=Dermacentor silvarum TaxID=543639 RepID=A0ACB8D7P5_DERSI|nr:hypothetical protein HPB49_019234 [Dermacentor silvarum]